MQAMQKVLFSEEDVGCYADAVNGEEHRRAVLADLLRGIGTEDRAVHDLVAELANPPSDDYGEEDEAIDILQAVTAHGLVWSLDAGDLILVDEGGE